LEALRAEAKGKAGDNTSSNSEQYRTMASNLMESFGHSGSPHLRDFSALLKKTGVKCENCSELIELSKKNVGELTLLMGQMFELKIMEQIIKLEDRETVITVDSKKFKQLSADIRELEEEKKQKIKDVRNTVAVVGENNDLLVPLDRILASAEKVSELLSSKSVSSESFLPALDELIANLEDFEKFTSTLTDE